MGLFRLLLALSVVIFHLDSISGFRMVPGIPAVRIFFVVSGFYMALILKKKYSNSYWLFITNRALRIYPAYWLILMSTTVYLLYRHLPLNIGSPELLLVNLTLLTPKAFSFLRSDNFMSLFQNSAAWSLTIEMVFYFFAPFITRLSTRSVVFLAFISFGIRYALFHWFQITQQLKLDDVFFPAELGFFLLGILAFRLYRQNQQWLGSSAYRALAAIILLAVVVGYNYLPAINFRWLNVNDFLFLLLSAALMPLVFGFSSRNRLDRFLGELSYPLYISHVPLIMVLHQELSSINGEKFKLVALSSIIVVSIVITRLLAEPVNTFREQRLKSVGRQSAFRG